MAASDTPRSVSITRRSSGCADNKLASTSIKVTNIEFHRVFCEAVNRGCVRSHTQQSPLHCVRNGNRTPDLASRVTQTATASKAATYAADTSVECGEKAVNDGRVPAIMLASASPIDHSITVTSPAAKDRAESESSVHFETKMLKRETNHR